MTIQLDVQYDTREIAIWLNAVNVKTLQRAVGSALNKTASSVKTKANQWVRKEIKLKAKTINAGFILIRANSVKSTLTDLKSQLKVSGKPIPLYHYSAKQTKQGVTVNVKGQRKLLKHAFIAQMKSGHRGVFVRKTKKRLPMDELYSTRISDVFYNAGFMSKLHEYAQEKLTQYVAQNMHYFFKCA